MSGVLTKCKSRKEMRRGNPRGLIRFRGGDVDEREVSVVLHLTGSYLSLQVILDDDYTAMAAASDVGSEEEDEEEGRGEEDEFEGDEMALQTLEDEDGSNDDQEEEEEPFMVVDNDEEAVDEDEEEEEEARLVKSKALKRKAAVSPKRAKLKPKKNVSFTAGKHPEGRKSQKRKR